MLRFELYIAVAIPAICLYIVGILLNRTGCHMSAFLEFAPASKSNTGSSLLARIAELVGLRAAPGSELALVAAARTGLSPKVLKRLTAVGLRAEDLAFIIPPRTLSHRLANGERLTVDESDRALRLARIIALAEIAFGDHAKALEWLRAPKRQFRDACALELIRTEAGARVVEELLTCVDEGYFA